MNGDPRRRRYVDGGDDELLGALRSLGEEYDPDLTAIQHRMSRAVTQRGVITHTTLHPSRPARAGTRAEARGRQGWLGRPVMLPIAAVILVVGGIVALMPHHPGQNSDGTVIAPAGAVSASTLMSHPPTASTHPSEPPARLGPAVSATEKSGGETPSPTTSAQQTAPTAPQPSVTVWAMPVTPPTHDVLSQFGRYDWIAIGARLDKRQVRAAQSKANPQVVVDQPADANVEYGRFRLNWTGGVPEASRNDDGSWLRTNGATGWSVTLMPSPTTVRRVLLYMGTSNLKASVEISGRDFVTQKFPLQQTGSTTMPMIVEVNVPRTSHHVYLHFSGTPTAGPPTAGTPPGRGPAAGSPAAGRSNFYLAGLTLRTNNQETAATK